ncbi:MAG: TlpA disulfide reductase family protein [Pseudomonadota bacterium]
MIAGRTRSGVAFAFGFGFGFALVLVSAFGTVAFAAEGTGGAPAAPSPDDNSRAGAAPARTVTTDDIRREMRKARGHVLIVHLWATWCGPCLGELPLIDAFARDARARGAIVLAYSLDAHAGGVARVPEVLRARAPSLPAAVAEFDDTQAFIALFSKSWEGSIPTTFAFDGNGVLRAAVQGGAERSDLDELLNGLFPPKRARAATGTAAERKRKPSLDRPAE